MSSSSDKIDTPIALAIRRRGRRWVNAALPYAFISPALAMILVFTLIPLALVFWYSVHNWDLRKPWEQGQFVGLRHFLTILDPGRDELFYPSLLKSFIWVFGSVSVQFICGLGLALMLNQTFFGRAIYRSIMLCPWAVSGVLTGLIWVWMFHETAGVINDLLDRAGLLHLGLWLGLSEVPRRVAWLAYPGTAMSAIIVANVWRGIAFFAISLLAGLQTISEDVYEAGAIDGAGQWQQFRYVTLPLLRDVIVVTTLLRSIWTFNFVDLIYTMTGGGPANSTLTLAVYTMEKTTVGLNYGYASALAVILFLILLGASVFYFKITGFARGGAGE